MTYMAYVEDSGDKGLRGSQTYVLSCVFLDADQWPQTFDGLISFRRYLRATFGVPMRTELKANHILRNAGGFRVLGLSENARRDMYRAAMRLCPKLGLRAYAVVIDKGALNKRAPGRDPRLTAWEYMLQRLERLTTKTDTGVVLIHDEGEEALVRSLARKARRAGTAGSAFGTGTLRVPARLLLDDPVPRNSQQSLFVQLADLCAYAAFRAVVPPPPRPVNIVTRSTWDELGTSRFTEVSSVRGGAEGIVVWPK